MRECTPIFGTCFLCVVRARAVCQNGFERQAPYSLFCVVSCCGHCRCDRVHREETNFLQCCREIVVQTQWKIGHAVTSVRRSPMAYRRAHVVFRRAPRRHGTTVFECGTMRCNATRREKTCPVAFPRALYRQKLQDVFFPTRLARGLIEVVREQFNRVVVHTCAQKPFCSVWRYWRSTHTHTRFSLVVWGLCCWRCCFPFSSAPCRVLCQGGIVLPHIHTNGRACVAF